mgnify:CR=1 FL=1
MQTIVSTPSDGRVRTSLIYLMETRAPAVVAVVVTTGPGPGLEATLASLVGQDYPDLSLLVLANGEHPDVAAISFVGSTPIAKYIYETGTKHGKRVQALGGAKNHMIVMPDADLDAAVDGIITIDEQRNAKKSAVVLKVEAQGFKYQETIAP